MRKLTLVLLILSTAYASYTFPAYRVIQAETDDKSIGSLRTSVDMPATDGGVVKLADLTIETIKNAQNGNTKTGLLVLFPETLANGTKSQVDLGLLEKWLIVEKYLLSTAVDMPIYFAMEDSPLLPLAGRNGSAQGGAGWRLVANQASAQPIAGHTTRNIQGWLSGITADDSVLPSIAIVAHHDTFGVVPGLASGVRDNGSGVAALMEIARLFSKLYSAPNSHGKYNIIFVITGGGKQNYQGAKYWLENTDSRLLDKIEAVICLDTLSNAIGEMGDLHLHIAREMKEKDTLYTALLENSMTVVNNMMDIDNAILGWEHERFLRRKINAATISTYSKPKTLIERSNLFDRGALPSTRVLADRVLSIAESLVKVIYGVEASTFTERMRVSTTHLTHWLSVLSESPRHSHHTEHDSPILKTLEMGLHEFVAAVPAQKFKLDAKEDQNLIAFNTDKIEMSLHHSQAMFFDLVLGPSVLIYLIMLFVAIKGVNESIASVKNTVQSGVGLVKKMWKR